MYPESGFPDNSGSVCVPVVVEGCGFCRSGGCVFQDGTEMPQVIDE